MQAQPILIIITYSRWSGSDLNGRIVDNGVGGVVVLMMLVGLWCRQNCNANWILECKRKWCQIFALIKWYYTSMVFPMSIGISSWSKLCFLQCVLRKNLHNSDIQELEDLVLHANALTNLKKLDKIPENSRFSSLKQEKDWIKWSLCSYYI